MKFRFWHDYTNARDSHYGTSLGDGNAVHVRGWDAGVKVTPRSRDRQDNPAGYSDVDEYDVYMTWGSHGGDGRTVFLGTVRDTTDGPVWVAEEVPACYTSTEAPGRRRQHRVRRSRASAATQDQLPTDHRVPAGRYADTGVFGPAY